MPTPYISRLKLEKELEKKARSLREKKSKCEEYIEKLNKFIKVLDKWMDTSPLVSLYEEAKKTYEFRDFDEALKKFKSLEEKIKNLSREKYDSERKKIEDMLKKIRREDLEEINDELKKADELFDKDLSESFHILSTVVERIEKIAQGEFEAKKLSLIERFASIPGYEWIKDRVEKIEPRGLEAMAELENLEKEIVGKLRKEVENIIVQADKLIDIASSAHYKFAINEENKQNALRLLEEGNYEEALAEAKEYYDSTKKAFLAFFNKLLGISRMLVEEGKMMEIDMGEQWKKLEEAEKYIKEEKFEEAIQSLREATDEAEKLKMERVLSVIKEMRDKFVEAKKRGIEIKSYMKMIENAKNLLKIGRHKRAYDLVREAINMLDRRLNLYQQLENELKEIKATLEDLRKENIILEGVDDRIKEIEGLLDEDVEKAEKKIDELKGIIKISLRDIALTLYQDINGLLEKAAAIGFESSEIKSEMEKIDEILKDEIYKEAIITLREIEDELYDSLYEYISGQLESLQNYGEEMAKMGEEIKALLESGELKKAVDEFTKLRRKIEELEYEKYGKRIEEIEEEAKFLQEKGINTAEIMGYLERAKKELEAKNVKMVESYLSKASNLLTKLRSLSAIELYNSLQRIVESAKNIGVDVEREYGAKLKEIESAMDSKEYEKVIDQASQLKDEIKSLRDKALKAKTLISELENRIKAMEKRGLDTSSLKDELSTLQELFKESKFEEILSAAQKMKDMLKETEMRGKAEKIKESIERGRDILKEIGRLKEYKGMINKFLKSYGKEDLGKIISDGEAILQAIHHEIEKVLKERLDTLEKDIGEFRRKGFYVLAEVEELKKIKELLLGRDYVEAYEKLKKLEKRLEDMKKREKKLREINESIKDRMNFASSLGIDLTTYEKRMSEIYQAPNYRQMEEGVNALLSDLEKDIEGKISEIINGVEKELDKMRKAGEDVTAPESLLTRARSSLANKDYRKALKYALNAMGEIEKFEMQKATAFGILRRIENRMKKMKALMPRDLLKQYQEARALFLKGDYLGAIEKSMDLSEKLWDIERITERIKERNSEIKEMVIKAHRAGMDVKNVLRLFNQAKVEYQKLHYHEAYRIVEECYQEARKLMDTLMEGYKKIYGEILKKIKETNMEEHFQESLEAIEQLFEKEDVEGLKARLSSLKEEVEEKAQERIKGEMDRLDEKIALAKKVLGAEYSQQYEKERERLEEMKNTSLEEFRKGYSQLMERIDQALLEGVKKSIEEFISSLESFEKVGLNVNEYYEKASKMLSQLTGENYADIFQNLEELKAAFHSFAKEYMKSYADSIVEKVEKYSKSLAKEMKERMDKLIQEGNYGELPNIAQEADKFIAEYKLNVQDLNRKVREIKDVMVLARKVGMDIKSYAEELKEVLSNIRDVKKVIGEVNEIEEKLKAAMDKLEPRVSIALDVKGKINGKYQAKVRVKNEGDVAALNVRLSVQGALNTDKPVEIGKIEKGEEKSLDVFLLPGEGEDVKLQAAYSRFDGKDFEKEEHVKIELKKKGFHIEKNKTKVKCAFCRGTILPGMDIVICDNCGAVYHLPCARRSGKCVKCGTLFNFE